LSVRDIEIAWTAPPQCRHCSIRNLVPFADLREKSARNRMLPMADYPLDAQGIHTPEVALCHCSESYIVAPVSGADARGAPAQGNAMAARTNTLRSFVLLR